MVPNNLILWFSHWTTSDWYYNQWISNVYIQRRRNDNFTWIAKSLHPNYNSDTSIKHWNSVLKIISSNRRRSLFIGCCSLSDISLSSTPLFALQTSYLTSNFSASTVTLVGQNEGNGSVFELDLQNLKEGELFTLSNMNFSNSSSSQFNKPWSWYLLIWRIPLSNFEMHHQRSDWFHKKWHYYHWFNLLWSSDANLPFSANDALSSNEIFYFRQSSRLELA